MERRSFLKAAGVTAGLTAMGSAEASAASPAASSSSSSGSGQGAFEIGPDRLTLGGELVVGQDGFPTIAEAWDAANAGDVIYVHSSYDAKAAGEQFPIVLDSSKKQVMLRGGHPTGSVIDARHTDENVIEVIGAGQNDYRNMPLVQNLKVVGGNIGMRVRAAPYSTFKDMVFYRNGSHGVAVESYTDPETGSFKGTFGASFRNCQAWSCGGDGFRVTTAAHPHSTTFMACDAMFNRGYGIMMRGYSTRWIGGTIQNNGQQGVDARKGSNQLISGVYFEGNGTRRDSPIEIYAAGAAHAIKVEECYFQGGFFRDFKNGRDNGEHCVVFAGLRNPHVSHCSYLNYDSQFVLVRKCRDADVNRPTHYDMDDTSFMSANGNLRLRSGQVILPTDLRSTNGKYRGDVGMHDGSGSGPWGFAIWTGSRWVSQVDGSYI